MPLSRDIARVKDLKRTLAVYRMVFGQPRQEDLVNFLKDNLQDGVDLEEILSYRIDTALTYIISNDTSHFRHGKPGFSL